MPILRRSFLVSHWTLIWIVRTMNWWYDHLRITWWFIEGFSSVLQDSHISREKQPNVISPWTLLKCNRSSSPWLSNTCFPCRTLLHYCLGLKYHRSETGHATFLWTEPQERPSEYFSRGRIQFSIVSVNDLHRTLIGLNFAAWGIEVTRMSLVSAGPAVFIKYRIIWQPVRYWMVPILRGFCDPDHNYFDYWKWTNMHRLSCSSEIFEAFSMCKFSNKGHFKSISKFIISERLKNVFLQIPLDEPSFKSINWLFITLEHFYLLVLCNIFYFYKCY